MKLILIWLVIVLMVGCTIKQVNNNQDCEGVEINCSVEYDGMICPDEFMGDKPFRVEQVAIIGGAPLYCGYYAIKDKPFDVVLAFVIPMDNGLVRLISFSYTIGEVQFIFMLENGGYVQTEPKKIEA